MTKDQIRPGMFLVSDGGPRLERSPSSIVQRDIAAEFDGHIERANAALDELARIKAKAKATKEWRDFYWRFG